MRSFLAFIVLCPYLIQSQTRKFLDCTCGEKIDPLVDTRVFGGTKASPNEFPWQAYLRIYSTEGAFVCGGTLINDRLVNIGGKKYI